MPPNVLIVDGENSIRELLSLVVSQFLNCEFGLAENSLEAIQKVQTEEYDLILIDIYLPPDSGIETIEILKNLKPDVPIIVMTDLGNNSIVHRALKSGADKVLSKPFTIKQMVESAGSFVLT